jgi:plasmid maintenance system killer protein
MMVLKFFLEAEECLVERDGQVLKRLCRESSICSIMHYASTLEDLRCPPGNRLESLSGDLKGHYSIRINNQWRIVFKWDSQPYDVRILDYH